MQLLFFNNWITSETLKAIGWALFHSLWIGLLAAAASGLIILATRRSSARLRYNLLMSVLFLFLISIVVVFFLQEKSSPVAAIELRETITGTTASIISSQEPAAILSNRYIDGFTRYFNANVHLFVFTWAIFFAFHCIRLFTGLAGVQRLRRYKTSLPGEEWLRTIKLLSDRLGVKQTVTLLQSEIVKVPVAMGYFKPVILVPLGLLSNLPPAQVETILLHELAHIRRGDYLMNLVQRMAEAVFFFNPGFMWLSSLIRQEREACCDDMVVATTGQQGSYLEALVAFQEYSHAPSGYAMAIRTKQHYLLNRVRRLLTRENKKLNLMEKILLVIGLTVFTAFTFIPQKEKAQRKHTATLARDKKAWQVINKVDKAAIASQKSSRIDPVVSEPRSLTGKSITDTVPKDRSADRENFSNISSNVHDDGKEKRETVTATDRSGKKYRYTKVNNKVTELFVDDKKVPESEFENYSSVINQIDRVREENRARKMKEKEARKAEMEKRKVEMQEKQKERKEMQDESVKLKEKMHAAKGDERAREKRKEITEKRLDSKRKELDVHQKMLDAKRKDVADARKELAEKRKEISKREGKEKENGLKEIKNREKEITLEEKKIENKKKEIEGKKKEIKEEKKKLKTIKDSEKKKVEMNNQNSVNATVHNKVNATHSNALQVSYYNLKEWKIDKKDDTWSINDKKNTWELENKKEIKTAIAEKKENRNNVFARNETKTRLFTRRIELKGAEKKEMPGEPKAPGPKEAPTMLPAPEGY